jgi:hypothetical protein
MSPLADKPLITGIAASLTMLEKLLSILLILVTTGDHNADDPFHGIPLGTINGSVPGNIDAIIRNGRHPISTNTALSCGDGRGQKTDEDDHKKTKSVSSLHL